MAHADPRLVQVPEDHRQLLISLIEAHGMPRAIEMVGVGRTALLAVVARGACLPGTASLIREFVRQREAA